MVAFVWTMMCLTGFGVLYQGHQLASAVCREARRTAAFGFGINIALTTWAIALLVRGH